MDVARLQEITGNGIDSYYGFTKMLWLRDNRPDVWERTRYLLPPNAYIAYVLTGEVAVDHSSAGNIGGIYDIEARGWSSEMLDELGIPAAMMPARLVSSTRCRRRDAARDGVAARAGGRNARDRRAASMRRSRLSPPARPARASTSR